MKRLKELSIPYLPFRKELIDKDFGELGIRHLNRNNYFYYNDMMLYPYNKRYPKEFSKLFDQSQLVLYITVLLIGLH